MLKSVSVKVVQGLYRSSTTRQVVTLSCSSRANPFVHASSLRLSKKQTLPEIFRTRVTPFSTSTMAPIQGKEDVQSMIKSSQVVVFSKTTCPFCDNVKQLFQNKDIEAKYYELNQMGEDGPKIQQLLAEITGQKTVPNVFINGRHVGGNDDTVKSFNSGLFSGLMAMASDEIDHGFEYDLIVVGGGSGGLAASKEAARLGRKVAVCDFVTPSPPGTTWGLGGTCVNVGCIPKKLMHQAALLGERREDSSHFGWSESKGEANWAKLVENVQNHIGSLNWGYKVALREKRVTYLNEYASFVDKNTLKTVNKKGKESLHTAQNFILATGGRPKYPDIPGAKEYGITSDDIFSLPYNPGKILFVGASYISLECAGFCHGIGLNSTVMVRSILLRGFDQQIANKIGDYMESSGINFIRECVPLELKKIEEGKDGKPGKIKVIAKYNDGTIFEDWFNTVCFAIGRDAETAKLNLDSVGVQLNPKNGKVIHDEEERTSTGNIYAIGDMLDGKPELTPVAIQAGILLARRLCRVSDLKTDYVNVPTTVFTPLEYGCVGLSEEDAIAKYGEDDIEVFHKSFTPLEWTVPHRPENVCYGKLICVKSQEEKVVGFHYLGPDAGEVTQGYAGMIQMGAKKADFDRLIGIHPTNAELFTTLDITKRSGVSPDAAGC